MMDDGTIIFTRDMFSTKNMLKVSLADKKIGFNSVVMKLIGDYSTADIRFDRDKKTLHLRFLKNRHDQYGPGKDAGIKGKKRCYDTDPIFETMGWNRAYRYRILGSEEDGELIFDLKSAACFESQ